MKSHTVHVTVLPSELEWKVCMKGLCLQNFNFTSFLKGQLSILAGINIQLQKSNQDLFTTYQKIIKCFIQTLLEPVLVERDRGLTEENMGVDC